MPNESDAIPSYDFSISIEVRSLGTHSFEELAPLADDLNELWVDVSSQRVSFPPPAAGPELALIDMAIAASFGVGIKAAFDLFLGKILEASAERIQKRVVDLIRSGSERSMGGRPPLSFTAGSVRFFFYEEVTAEDLETALAAARQIGASLQDGVFEAVIPPGDGPHEWQWDSILRHWTYRGGPSASVESSPIAGAGEELSSGTGAGNDPEQAEWIPGVPVDSPLRALVDSLQSRVEVASNSSDLDDAIRRAFVTFEERIRDLCGLPSEKYGKDLIDAAFHPQNGVLQPISPSGAECAGLHHYMLGTILLFRNPVAHKSVAHSRQGTWRILNHIDHALALAQEAANNVVDVARYFSPHEGHITRRRDFRLDVDQDGVLDVVILVEAANNTVVVLSRQPNGSYRRLAAETVPGYSGSLHGPGRVRLHNVTNPERPDLVVTWLSGESSDLTHILRWHDGRYVVVRSDVSGKPEPYANSSDTHFLEHDRQYLHFVDFDGDGLEEVVQVMSFDRRPVERAARGLDPIPEGMWARWCRVFKWNSNTQQLETISENEVLEPSKW